MLQATIIEWSKDINGLATVVAKIGEQAPDF
jgi:hypothetical protein